MNQEELNQILADHKLWLEGKGGKRANLQGVNLQGVNLQEANLQGANLQGTNLQDANLKGTYLQWVNLQGVNLQGANLRWTDLQEANLQGANLQGTYLQWANLQDADLQGANIDFAGFKLRCGFGFAKTDAKLRKQLIAHVASFFVNSELNDEEKALYNAMAEYCSGWHRESEFGKLEKLGANNE